MRKTVTILIGNSDDKLTQSQWAEFIRDVNMYLSGTKYQFSGTSHGDAEWQNACWVVEIDDHEYDRIKRLLSILGKEYKQDSIAWIEGEAELI